MILSLTPLLQLGLAAFAVSLIAIGALTVGLLWRATPGAHTEDTARRILHNSTLPLGIQLLVRAIDFAFVAIFFRVLAGQEAALGDYELAALLVTLYLGTISEWGLQTLLTREVARDPAAIAQSFGTALLLRFALAFAMLPVAFLVIGAYAGLQEIGVASSTFSSRATLLVAILTLTLVPGALGSAITSVFVAMERPILPALANLGNNVASALLRLAALLLGFGVVGVAWAALAATLLNAGVFIALLRRHFGWPGWGWDRSLAGQMLRAAFPLMLNSLLVGVFFRFDTFVVKMYQGSEGVLHYGAAYKVAQLALILPPIVVNALFPLFSRQALADRAALLRSYRLAVRLLLIGALPFAAIVSILAPSIVALFFGASLVGGAAPALALLIWFVPLSYVNGIAQYVLIALNRQGTITWAFALTAIFNLATNLWLAPRWGLAAPALITVASEMVLYLPFRRALSRDLGGVGLGELLWRPAAATLACAAIVALLRGQPLLAAVVGLGVYAGILWAIGGVTAEDRRLGRRLLGRAGR